MKLCFSHAKYTQNMQKPIRQSLLADTTEKKLILRALIISRSPSEETVRQILTSRINAKPRWLEDDAIFL